MDPEVVAALRSARQVAVLTGAGVSAESGIPTFRDALTGLWADYRPEDLATPEGFRRNPELVWRWYRGRRLAVAQALPNAGHRALAVMERLVPRLTLITQNVDGLHARAGSTDVVELHGNIGRVKCFGCAMVASSFEDTDRLPRCSACGDMLRPDVVWFGELLPTSALTRAEAAATGCDMFLSIGTSNLVQPAASLPWIAAERRALVVVINLNDDGQTTGERVRFLPGRSGELLPRLVAATWPDAPPV